MIETEYADVLTALRNAGAGAEIEHTGSSIYAIRVEHGAWFLRITTKGLGGIALKRGDHGTFEVGRYHADDWGLYTHIGMAETVDDLVALVRGAMASPPSMKFTFDVLAIAMVELSATSEEAAREVLRDYQGARFETRAVYADAGSDGYKLVELITVSTRGRAALMEAYDENGNQLLIPDVVVDDPECHAVMPDSLRTELEGRLRAYEAAVGEDGLSGDAEQAAASLLAETVRRVLAGDPSGR